MITANTLNDILDLIANQIIRASGYESDVDGNSTWGLGWGDESGMARGPFDLLESRIISSGDLNFIGQVSQGFLSARQQSTAESYLVGVWSEMIRRMDSVITSYQVPNATRLYTYLAWLNAQSGNEWQAVQHPIWRDLFALFSPGVTDISPMVFWQRSAPGGLASINGSTFTAGTAIDGTKYSGGVLQMQVVSGTGSWTLTCSGTAWSPASKSVVACTWTGSGSGTSGSALTPSVANARAVSVTSGSITGTANVSLVVNPPAGRMDDGGWTP